MRIAPAALLSVLALVAACASDDGADPAPPAVPSQDPGAAALGADLLPFTEAVLRFDAGRGREAVLSTRPAGGAVLKFVLSGEGMRPREIDVLREGDSIFFRAGPERGTELLRLGATPGDAWSAPPATVRFDGWERVSVPAGTYDCARIVATSGGGDIARVDTWWFARDLGLVKLRSEYGTLFTEEMSLLGLSR